MKKEFWGLLKGPAQVMFQANALSGAIMLLGVFWGAIASGTPQVAFGGVVGLAISTLTGYLLNLPSRDGRAGLWGFNGVLVGCAFMTFLGNTPLAWAALILASAMTTWVRSALNRLGEPLGVSSYTFHFVMST
jgi:urea transporter